MFMTSLNVAVGLVAAARLLADRDLTQAAYVLHAAGFVIAAPVALAGTVWLLRERPSAS